MSAIEHAPQPEDANYREPEPSQLIPVSRADLVSHKGLLNHGFRVKMIDGDEVVYERRQEGVTSYPPVKVTDNPYPRDLKRLTT